MDTLIKIATDFSVEDGRAESVDRPIPASCVGCPIAASCPVAELLRQRMA